MYQHGRRTKQTRNIAMLLATVAVAGVVIVIVWFIIHKDIANQTNPKATVPILTEVTNGTGENKKITENFFSMELPSDWEFIEHRTGNRINAYVYHSTAKGKADRTLYVHQDIMPPSYKIVRLQPLHLDGNSVNLGNLSDECINFGQPEVRNNAPFEAKWENIIFICDPIRANQTIGTGVEGSGIGARIGNHTYFFYYEDHNINPDSNLFRNILKTFVAK